jgi:hypothetical protein
MEEPSMAEAAEWSSCDLEASRAVLAQLDRVLARLDPDGQAPELLPGLQVVDLRTLPDPGPESVELALASVEWSVSAQVAIWMLETGVDQESRIQTDALVRAWANWDLETAHALGLIVDPIRVAPGPHGRYRRGRDRVASMLAAGVGRCPVYVLPPDWTPKENGFRF